MSSSGLWEASLTDKNPCTYGSIANKANGSGAVIFDKTVVLRLYDRQANDNIVILNCKIGFLIQYS